MIRATCDVIVTSLDAGGESAALITVNPTGTEFVVTEQPFAARQTLRVLTRDVSRILWKRKMA